MKNKTYYFSSHRFLAILEADGELWADTVSVYDPEFTPLLAAIREVGNIHAD